MRSNQKSHLNSKHAQMLRMTTAKGQFQMKINSVSRFRKGKQAPLVDCRIKIRSKHQPI